VNPFNPEAGDVPAPTDPAELALVRRASAVVWRAVPYLAWRYGERGRRFGLSDGAWLVTLSRLPEAARIPQVEWLASVLAPRGMPSCLLETQLLVTGRLGRRGRWRGANVMEGAARHLGDLRRRHLDDAAFAEAGRRFARQVDHPRIGAGTGRLVASAVVDVALGFSPSAAPLVDWLADPTIFPPSWRDAVVRTRTWVEAAVGRP